MFVLAPTLTMWVIFVLKTVDFVPAAQVVSPSVTEQNLVRCISLGQIYLQSSAVGGRSWWALAIGIFVVDF